MGGRRSIEELYQALFFVSPVPPECFTKRNENRAWSQVNPRPLHSPDFNSHCHSCLSWPIHRNVPIAVNLEDDAEMKCNPAKLTDDPISDAQDIDTESWPNKPNCVVPENIHTLPTEGIHLEFPGGGGSKAQENSGGGGLYQFILFFPGQFHYSHMLNFFVYILLSDPRTQTLILLTAQK